MLQLGQYNKLRVIKLQPIGVFLDGGEYGEILMPAKYVPQDVGLDDIITAFVYRDTEDLVIATTEEPKAVVGDIALLLCKQVTDFGAFMDWGLIKDLLVPFREQIHPLQAGNSYWVKVYLDKVSQRVVGSTKLDRFINNNELAVIENDEVELIIYGKTEMGYKAIVNGKHWGLLYKNEVFKPIRVGEQLRGYIKKIRSENKLDLSLQKQGFSGVQTVSNDLLTILKKHNGFLPLTDDSAPDEIYRLVQMSKKTFKKSVGLLYKQKVITLNEKGITLVH